MKLKYNNLDAQWDGEELWLPSGTEQLPFTFNGRSYVGYFASTFIGDVLHDLYEFSPTLLDRGVFTRQGAYFDNLWIYWVERGGLQDRDAKPNIINKIADQWECAWVTWDYATRKAETWLSWRHSTEGMLALGYFEGYVGEI